MVSKKILENILESLPPCFNIDPVPEIAFTVTTGPGAPGPFVCEIQDNQFIVEQIGAFPGVEKDLTGMTINEFFTWLNLLLVTYDWTPSLVNFGSFSCLRLINGEIKDGKIYAFTSPTWIFLKAFQVELADAHNAFVEAMHEMNVMGATDLIQNYWGEYFDVPRSGWENIEKSLIGYWKFDEDNGLTAYDSSIYKNNAMVSGSITDVNHVDGKIKKALMLNASNQGVNCGHSFPLTQIGKTNFSFSFWAKTTTPVETPRSFVYVSNATANISFGYDRVTNHCLRFYLRKWPVTKEIYFRDLVPPNDTWAHIVLVCDITKGIVNTYLNKKKSQYVLHLDSTIKDYSENFDFYFGLRASGTNQEYLDDFRIYNTALTENEIDSLHNFEGDKISLFDLQYAQQIHREIIFPKSNNRILEKMLSEIITDINIRVQDMDYNASTSYMLMNTVATPIHDANFPLWDYSQLVSYDATLGVVCNINAADLSASDLTKICDVIYAHKQCGIDARIYFNDVTLGQHLDYPI